MTLTFEDLYKACPKCKGEKKVPVIEGSEDVGFRGEAPCPDCKGRGGEYTEAGLAMEKFLRRLKIDGRL